MIILPFLLGGPINNACLAYLAIHEKIKLYEGTFMKFEVRYGTSQYNESIREISLNALKKELQPLLDQEGIRKDLMVVDMSDHIAAAKGTHFFPNSQLSIGISRKLFDTDKEAALFIAKHEVSHIKHNDVFLGAVITAISSFVVAIFAVISFSALKALLVTFLIGRVVSIAYTRFYESRADDFAIANSTTEELKGGRRFFLSSLNMGLEQRANSFWQKILYSATGEERLDISHPSLSSRISKIEKELANRNVQKESYTGPLEKYVINRIDSVLRKYYPAKINSYEIYI